jgi:hypothetical protein
MPFGASCRIPSGILVQPLGSRHLTPGELGNDFGLPAHLSLGGFEAGMFPFVPVQVSVGCLDSLGQSNILFLQALSTPACRVWALPLVNSFCQDDINPIAGCWSGMENRN